MDAKKQLADLRTVLTRTAADGVDGGRICEAETPEAALSFVLQHISSTMLGRVLTFTFGDETGLSVEVVGRRLTRVVGPLPDNAAPEAAQLLNEMASGEEDIWLARLADLLRSAAELSQSVVFNAAPVDGGADPMRRGATPEQLAEALNLTGSAADTAETVSGLSRFLDIAGDGIVCAEKVEEEKVEKLFGAEADLAQLSARVDGLMQEAGNREGHLTKILGRHGLLVLGARGGDDTPRLVIGAHDGVFLVALARAKDSLSLPALWQSTIPASS